MFNRKKPDTLVLDWISNRLASEAGFTLIELLVVMQLLVILALIGEPAYVGTAAKARVATAQSNVSSAITPATSYYADTSINPTPYTYSSISGAKLRLEAPGVSSTLKAGSKTVSSTADAFCMQDSGDGGASFYRYEGGNGGATTLASGPCAAAYSVS
jgi:prepilin-type N-terminal cleavage/methylation domain-containing protein